MSAGNELSWRGRVTGVTDYATIRRATDQLMWGVPHAAFEELTVANWAYYVIALTETPASSFFYVGTWPAGVSTAGWYWVDFYRQSGVAAAISDEYLGEIYGWWNGTKFEPAGGDIAQVAATAQTARDLGLALPAVAPGAKGGLPITDASTGLVLTGYGGGTVKNDLIDAPNATAVTAIGTGVWATTSRTLSSFGTLVADIATAVWGATTRTLSAFGFSVACSDKAGFSLSATGLDLVTGSATFVTNLVAAIWGVALSTLTVTNSIGLAFKNMLTNMVALGAKVWSNFGMVYQNAGVDTTKTIDTMGGGAAGDPWSTPVPGAYAGGTAGYQLGRIGSAGATFATALTTGTLELTLTKGDDYLLADGRHIDYTLSGQPTMVGATVTWRVKAADGTVLSIPMITVSATVLRLELTAAQTALLALSVSWYDIEAVLADKSVIRPVVHCKLYVVGSV